MLGANYVVVWGAEISRPKEIAVAVIIVVREYITEAAFRISVGMLKSFE